MYSKNLDKTERKHQVCDIYSSSGFISLVHQVKRTSLERGRFSKVSSRFNKCLAGIGPPECFATSDFSPSTKSLLVYCCITAKLTNFPAGLLRSVAREQSGSNERTALREFRDSL